MASTYLQRNIAGSSDGNMKTWTFSAWVKRSSLGTQQAIFTNGENNSGEGKMFFDTDDTLAIQNDGQNGSNNKTSRVFRDVYAWYHIVWAVDANQASNDDRWKLYINGELIPASEYGSPTISNADGYIQRYSIMDVGVGVRSRYQQSGNAIMYFDGSMTHVHFIDGTQYAASDFGQTDSTTGIWKPKTAPSVTYGTNGFFLKFASSGSMGTDSSGNGNNFTVSGNLTQTQDTPSNVFCTLNPLSVATNHTLTNANLTSTNSSSSQGGVNGTLNYPTSGKWYHEVKINAEDSSKGQGVGIGDNVYRSDWGTYSNFVGYLSDGTITAQGDAGYTSYGTAQNVGDIIGVAYNADDQELTFYLNGTSQGVITTSSMDGTIDFNNLCPLAFGRNMGQSFNFGNGYFGTTAVSSANSDGDGIGLFEYAVPSGYYALCTKNINTYG